MPAPVAVSSGYGKQLDGWGDTGMVGGRPCSRMSVMITSAVSVADGFLSVWMSLDLWTWLGLVEPGSKKPVPAGNVPRMVQSVS